MRTPLLAANWKLYKSLAEALAYADALLAALDAEGDCLRVELAVCPPFPLLYPLAEAFKGSSVSVGAQNVSEYLEGAFTGETGINQLDGLGLGYVIIGHSERRNVFRESNEAIADKLKIALTKSSLVPILCVGEPLDYRKDGRELDFVKSQLQTALKDVEPSDAERIVIAYEPIWAIGTGVNAEPKDAEEMAAEIRDWLSGSFGIAAAQSVRILYGGSIKPANWKDIYAGPNVDGGLVGGASLDPADFYTLYQLMLG